MAAQNHNIYIFSFLTGTTITNFYAHDDTINQVIYTSDTLITCSNDQTIRVFDLKSSNFKNPQIFYDHEEEIVSISVSTSNYLASLDTAGVVVVRDLKKNDVISTIELPNVSSS